MSDNTKFEYTYSAKQQEEIEAIRKKYMPQEEDKMELLRRLDRKVESSGTVVGLLFGVVALLIFGAGMSMCLVGSSAMFIPGILVGLVGIVPMVLAYPMYKKVIEAKRKELAPQIIALTDELRKQN
ncbi:MAG: hypothetical protein J6J16_00705 [Lachnospiraceae bacterium]|nr:hypothetical protein [Lachnospiraceae bacterium]